MQLADKIIDTNTRIDALENKVKHAPVSYTHLDVYKRQI